MKDQKLLDFLHRYAENRHSEQEHLDFVAWISTLEDKEIQEVMSSYKQLSEGREVMGSFDQSMITQLEQRLDAVDSIHEIGKEKSYPRKKATNYYKYLAAAVLLLVLSSGLFFYLEKEVQFQHTDPLKSAQNDFVPGGNKAVLTLADGSKIFLTDHENGEIAKQAGLKITKTKDGMLVYEVSGAGQSSVVPVYNTISTPRGGQYQVNLSDGTKVWLNAASSIKFPTTFAKATQRKVELTGEAYFEVIKDKTKPFFVASADQQIEVLGTHFNVNAYQDEGSTKTTLLEGSVKVFKAGHNDSKTLVPGEQAVVDPKTASITLKSVDLEGAIAWKKGFFQFKGDDVATVMRQLSRWYDVEVEYEGKIPQRALTGEIDRNVKASQVLDILKYADIHYHIQGRKIIIVP